MAKRANGEGSIYKRDDGTWCGQLSHTDEAGRSRRRTVYGRTRAEVRCKLTEAQDRLSTPTEPRTVESMRPALDGDYRLSSHRLVLRAAGRRASPASGQLAAHHNQLVGHRSHRPGRRRTVRAPIEHRATADNQQPVCRCGRGPGPRRRAGMATTDGLGRHRHQRPTATDRRPATGGRRRRARRRTPHGWRRHSVRRPDRC